MNDNLEKAKGKVEEVTGKVTGNEETEFKGKAKQKLADIDEGVKDIKEDVADKANDVIDDMDGKK